MLFKEYEEHLAVYPKEKQVWVCDIRFDDYANKPIRRVVPQFVETTSNEALPKNKKVYYADYHFRPILGSGKIGAKIIAPYDNTGFRGYTGVSLNIFLTQKECEEFYKEQCEKAKAGLEKYKAEIIALVNSRINEIDVEIITSTTTINKL